MRIRRKVLAPLILAIGAIGSLAAGPGLSAAAAAAPAGGVAAVSVQPGFMTYH